MKYILIIGDGMADFSVAELGDKTPLQYARTPFMDTLAAKGETGEGYNVPEGLPAGSDTAILSIFGCDPRVCYTGRAPLEVAAAGIALEPGDAAYRCNMVTYEDKDGPLDHKRILSHSAGSIEGDESIAIVTALFDDPRFKEAAASAGLSIHKSLSFRHFVTQKAVSLDGIKLIPPHDHLGEEVGPLMPSGCPNAEVLKNLMYLAHDILDRHPLNEKRRREGKMPANGVWFWAEGTAVKLPDFSEQYGKTGGVISAVPLCHGIASLTGLEVIHVEGATGEIETNYQGKVDAAIDTLARHDFAAIHIEAPDECTHNGDLKGKLQAIEYIDSRVVGPLLSGLDEKGWDYRILILSDHKTLISTRGHDGSSVPYLIYDSRRDTGNGGGYNEVDCAKGKVVEDGLKFMEMLFSE